MTELAFSIDELRTLADMACNGALTEQDAAQLEQLLQGNAKAQQLYLARVSFDTWLRWKFASEIQEPAPLRPAVPILSFLSTAYHGTVGYFSQETPFSFLVGASITGLLVLIAWLIPVSSWSPIAKNSSSRPSVNQRQFTSDPTMEIVGKITGMVDCKWADPNTAAFNGANVRLGRKYALASGLMEITYNTGAKVILQGPVTYSVENNGGYLAIGKLTGKLETKAEGGRPGTAAQRWSAEGSALSTPSNPQSPISNAFVIRTPTVTVTDLGTEFGVEVRKDGQGHVRVFQGRVVIQTRGLDGVAPQTIELDKDEAVSVQPRGVVTRYARSATESSTMATLFARELPQTRRSNQQPDRRDLRPALPPGRGPWRYEERTRRCD